MPFFTYTHSFGFACLFTISTHALVCHHQFASFWGNQFIFINMRTETKRIITKMRKLNVCLSLEHSLSPLSRTSSAEYACIFYISNEARTKKNATKFSWWPTFVTCRSKFYAVSQHSVRFISWFHVGHNESQEFWFRLFGPHGPGRAGASFLVFHLHRNSRRSFNLDYGRPYLWSSFTECGRRWAQPNSKLITPNDCFWLTEKLNKHTGNLGHQHSFSLPLPC